MKIAEIFYSIQGEGKLVGAPSVFVRVSGCNLRCVWCDTPYASWRPEGREMMTEEIMAEVEQHPTRYTVITGGEPMMFGETVELIGALKAKGKHVTVETAGTLWPEGMGEGFMDLASVSPKLATSTPWQRDGGRFAAAHEHGRIRPEMLRKFAENGVVRDRQWKFVVTRGDDLREIEALVASIGMKEEDVMLMPEGTEAATLTKKSLELAELCKAKGWRMSPRWHVYLWGNTKGT
jgi:7-carboxy-7-deazaguanine synthase